MYNKKNKWKEIDTLVDPKSKIAVRISENEGKFNLQITRELDENRLSKFINIPCEGAEHNVEDIVFTLVKMACKKIQKFSQDRQTKEERKRKSNHSDNTRGNVVGLSGLARRDAEAAGHVYVGPTQKKKNRNKRKD
jgi:hypothetical protein